MASPQKENGYTAISNEIMEALAKYRIPGQEMQLLWVLLRKTWGWNRKSDYISLSQWARSTGIKRTKCAALLNSLIAKKVVIKDSPQKGTGKASRYRFNKDFETWKASPQKETPVPKKGLLVVPKRGTKVVPKKGLTKEKKEIKERAQNVIQYLNETYNRKFIFTDGTLKHAIARLKEGFTEEDLKRVMDIKWNDEKFDKKYFRPSTLFNSEKFQEYLNEEPKQRYT